jgi:hypothetical protein
MGTYTTSGKVSIIFFLLYTYHPQVISMIMVLSSTRTYFLQEAKDISNNQRHTEQVGIVAFRYNSVHGVKLKSSKLQQVP